MVNHQTLAKQKIIAEFPKYQTKMSDISNLKPGESYRVIKEFTDYDGNLHKVRERWIFVKIDYLPYHSGLSLNVIENGESITYRFQDEPDQQQLLLERFMNYVAA